jgi:hypothetical protein
LLAQIGRVEKLAGPEDLRGRGSAIVEEAKKIGVRAFVAKTKAGEALVKSIEEAVTSGEFVLMD